MSSFNPRLAQKTFERRRHRRAKISVTGRYMLENKQEFACRSVNISPGGMLVAAPAKGELGQKAVLYFETFGRLEGAIVRHTIDGFAIEFTMSTLKRDKLADLLTWMINHDYVGLPEDRRHRRIAPHQTHTIMIGPDGENIPVEIADVSVSGVGVHSEVIPPIGSRVEVGRRAGRVVRHFDGGLAVEFARLIPIEEFDEDIIL